MLDPWHRILDPSSWLSLAAALVGMILLRDAVRAILMVLPAARDLWRRRGEPPGSRRLS